MQIFCSRAYIPFYSFIILNFFSISLIAQVNSPYSRRGIGDLQTNENIPCAGMGGLSNAVGTFGQINYLNPASYSTIGITTLQTGFTGIRNRITSKDSFNVTGGLQVSFLQLGLPIGKKGGAAVGIMPESNIEYRSISQEKFFDTIALQRVFAGRGGIQKFFLGYGYKFKNFQVGANVNFLFGNYNKRNINQFYDSLDIYSSEFGTYNSANGINFTLGGIYQYTFKNQGAWFGKKISFGATFQPQSTLNVTTDLYKSSYLYSVQGADTVEKAINKKTKTILPSKFGVGLLLSSADNWKIGLDYNVASWSNYRADGVIDSTTDAWSLKLGGSYRQSLMENVNFLRRVDYRVGAFTGKEYLRLNSTDIHATGVSVGLGLPLKIRSLSFGMINLALALGKRGTIENGLISEGFTRFSFGINVSEKWFRKQRYD